MGECPLCGESTNKPNTRLIKESCGHSKCRLCLINEESGCSICEGNNGEISRQLESIGNFDYHLPATTLPQYEELHATPRKLDFNKIPDDFIDCPLVGAKLTTDNSINQTSENVAANIPASGKVDIGTETDSIVPEKHVQIQTIQENTHSSISQLTQPPTQPVTKVPEVFAPTVSNNHQLHQETPPIVQNSNFIPVTQRADGRQFITIAFIANNSPNKNQQVVGPLLNQCLPALTNMTAVQRPGGGQCIPMLGNISALQNGNQFIIRNPNIVQNIVGNQSIPVIGNLQNISGNQSLAIVGNANAVKNLVGNQPLPPLTSINSLQSSTKGQQFPAAGSPNVVHKVVGNQPCQATQAVPNKVKEQSAQVQENANTARKQVRTRGLPRIKTVKNVNIVQKSATNQSDKVRISQLNRSPVQAVRGKRQRKELPVYLVPRKQTEQKKSPTTKSPPMKSPTMKSPPQAIGCMSPEFKLEDYLLFNKHQNANGPKVLVVPAETVNDTQMINKPSESVINETPVVSEQFNCTVIEEKFIENKVDESEHEGQVPDDKTSDEKSTMDVSLETDECKENQDLSVVFNVRDENKPTFNENTDNEKGKIKMPNGGTTHKEEYQNLDVLFDIIEKESQKLNGGIFDKVESTDLDEGNGLDYEENQQLHDKMNNEKDADQVLNQEVNIEGEKDQIFNSGIYDEHNEDQRLNEGMNSQINEIENLNKEVSCDNVENSNSHENYEQEQSLVEELPIQNGEIGLVDEQTGCEEEEHHILNTEMKDQKEESEILDNIADSSIVNNEVYNEEEIQTSDEKIDGVENESENEVHKEPSLQQENDQRFDGGIMTEEEDNYNENAVNDHIDNIQNVNEKIDTEERNNQQHYDDISEEEKDSEELNNENQELESPGVENNHDSVDYQHLNENTAEDESQILEKEAVDEDGTNQSLTLEMYEDENTNEPFDTNNDVPACETNNSDNVKLDATQEDNEPFDTNNDVPACETNNSDNVKLDATQEDNLKLDATQEDNLKLDATQEDNLKLDATQENNLKLDATQEDNLKLDATQENNLKLDATQMEEESGIVKKRRGRPKKSLPEVLKNNDKKDNQNLDTKADANERDESMRLETHIDKDVLHENINANSTLVEAKKSENENPDATTDNAQSIVVRQRRGRKKKSFSDYELDIKTESSSKKAQLLVKKPRGRPKKSLTNAEQPDKPNDSQEIEQPVTPKKLPSFSIENKHEEDENQQLNEKLEERQFLEVNVQIHNQRTPKKSTHNKEESMDSNDKSSSSKKPRGRPKSKLFSNDKEQDSLQADIDAISPFVEETEPAPQTQTDTVNEKENSTIVKRSRGRPKKTEKKWRGGPRKSLTNSEQLNESNVSQETALSSTATISDLCKTTDDEESREQHGRDEVAENEAMNSQDETYQDSVDMDSGEKESLQPDIVTNATVKENEPSLVVKPTRGRPKKSLSIFEQHSQPKASDVNVKPTVVKKPVGRPRKSLPSLEQPNQLAPQETEMEAINDKVSKEQHTAEEGQDLNGEVLETIQQENLHSDVVASSILSDKNESDDNAPIVLNEKEQVIIIKKRGGRPRKSSSSNEQKIEHVTSDVNAELTIVKKPRGRPRKSLSISEQQNEPEAQEAEAPNTTEISNLSEVINDKESVEQHERDENQMLDGENFDETLQNSTVDMDNGENENAHSSDTTNVTFSNNDNLDAEKSIIVNGNEPSVVAKKSRGRPKKSLSNREQQSQPDVSHVNVVKKPKGRPKKSSSIFEQNQLFKETELSNPTEISTSGKNINDEEGKQQHETHEETQDLNGEDVETSQNESLQSDFVTTFSDKNETDDKQPNAASENEQMTVVKKSVDRPKKSRGRPKKSLSNLEQTNLPVNSELDGEKDQAQCLNGANDKEKERLADTEIDSHDDVIQSLHAEDDGSSILNTEVNSSCSQNSVDDHLDSTRESEQTTAVKKGRGRPRKEKSQEPIVKNPIGRPRKEKSQESIVKKPRGRPKKASHEQPSESDSSQNKEHQTDTKQPSLCTDYSDEKDEQALHENVAEKESPVSKSEDGDREETNQIKTPNEENKSSLDDNEKENVDNQEQGNDLISNEGASNETKVISTLSQESDEVQVKQQSCNEISNEEGENHDLPKDSDEQAEEQDSKNLEAQDDENKENKKEYSEKDDTQIENITPTTEEHDLEKANGADDQVPKNSSTGRKYKKFDKMNEQVIVESGKRKRKPKVLLYENEDLDISPLKKKKKELNKSSSENESKTPDKKSIEKTQVDSSAQESAVTAKQDAESNEIVVKKVSVKNQSKENETTTSIELDQNPSPSNVNENSMDTEISENNVSTAEEDTKSIKRNRRPKTLLYENEDLKITPKSKKKKVEFLLPASKDSTDSNNTEKDDSIQKEDNKLEASSSELELPTTAKKSERVRKPKTLMYENERLTFTPVKEKGVKFEISKEDLMIMKKFNIKLELLVVLERNVDLNILKKYRREHETTHVKKRKLSVDGKKPRGRPKLSNGSAMPKSVHKASKVIASKYQKLKLIREKKRSGRPSKDCSHIITLPGEPPTYKCTICSRSFKHYANKTLHSTCVKTPKKAFKCELCPKEFYSKTHLQYHVRVHKGEKPFRCDYCGKQFVQNGKLNRHLLIHKYSQDLECNECGKKFVSKEYLKSHLLSHVKSSFVFRCNQCPKSFSQECRRKRHMLSHKRAKRYICSYCNQQFGRFDNYSRHMLHHHSVEPNQDFLPGRTNSVILNAPSNEEKSQEKKKDKSSVKPKKISRTPSNPVPIPINFIQPLTPPSAPSPYSMSHNHELASVIRETLPDLNNAVPVINAPISVKPSLSLIDPIPLEQALVLNRQIEEKMYTQSSFCEFPGLTRRANVMAIDRRQSFTFARRSSAESNSNSTDGTNFLTVNHEQQDDAEMSPTKRDIHVHWRRRTAETFKSKIDENE